MHVGRIASGVLDNLDLRIVDAGEVASACGLMLLGLKGKRVTVHTGVWATSVVVVGLDLVEILTLLFLETVLAVEDKLEGVEGTADILDEAGVTTDLTDGKEGRASAGGGDEGIADLDGVGVGLEHNVGGNGGVGEVPQGVLVGGGIGEAPHKLLNGVVVGEADLLGTGGGDGVGAGVLNLLNEVLVTFLGKTPTLLSVEVNVISPNLEGVGVKEGVEIGR